MLHMYCESPLLISTASNMHIFIQYLEEYNYSKSTIQKYVNALIHFAHWQHKHSRYSNKATTNDKTSFIKLHLPNCRCPPVFSRCKKSSAAALSHWLRQVVKPNSPPPILSENDKLVMAFNTYLKDVAGLTPSTLLIHRRNVFQFLAWLDAEQAIPVNAISLEHLTAFICLRATQVSLATTARVACSINVFLRFLSTHNHYLIHEYLQAPRPKLLHRLPDKKAMSDSELQKLLNGIDRSCPVGKRDYAMARCLCDLGIRTSEVASLTIDNIDWRNKIIEIDPGKTRRQHKLPVPDTLMEALVDYLTNSRPVTNTRQIFVYHRAPVGRPVKASTVRAVVRRAFLQAGFDTAQSQVHRLRHTMATRLLTSNTPIKIIADVLGHQSINTTIKYTYVDQVALQMVAMPWPVRSQS